MYCHVAALGHNESALLFALLRAPSQGGILPERQRHSVCAEIPASSRHVSSYIVWTVFPLPSPSVMVAANCSEKSVCDRHLLYLVSCQTSTRWKTSNMVLDSHTHTHTHSETAIAGYCSGPSRKTKPKHTKNTPRKRVLLCKNLQTKANLMASLKPDT